MAAKPLRREIELDFIRGIAILTVVDYHSPRGWLFTPFKLLGFQHFGWFGVDLFFVLSGFLVGGLLVKEWKLSGRIESGRFLIRRGLKIWPPYYVLMASMLITGHRTVRDLWGNLLNIQNYTHGVAFTWSLAVEEHAYILLVIILAVAARLAVRMRTLFTFLAVLSAFVIVLRYILLSRGYDVFYATHTRIEAIFYGVLLAMLYHYHPATFRRIQHLNLIWWPVLIGGLLYFRFSPHTPLGSWLTIDAANITSIAIVMLLYRQRLETVTAPAPLRSGPYRFVAWIGLYSYGIYLWHVSMISPVDKVGEFLTRHHVPFAVVEIWEGVAPLALAIALGVFFTKLIEFPTLKLRDRIFPKKVDSAVGIPAEFEAEAATLQPAPNTT